MIYSGCGSGVAFWGLLRDHSDDLTRASSIAYYALLSLFPFFLVAFSILGSVSAGGDERAAILKFVLAYFPSQFEFVTEYVQDASFGGISPKVRMLDN